MKPVVQRIIDKNGAEEMRFNASSRMILYAALKGEYPAESDAEVCGRAKIDPQLPGRWKAKYGSMYTDWLEEAIDQVANDEAKILERVGMIHAAQGNFNFWKEMAKTKGVIKEPEGKGTIVINTDFSAIAIGGSFEEMRAKILAQHRGMGSLPAPEPKTIEMAPVRAAPAPKDVLEF